MKTVLKLYIGKHTSLGTNTQLRSPIPPQQSQPLCPGYAPQPSLPQGQAPGAAVTPQILGFLPLTSETQV